MVMVPVAFLQRGEGPPDLEHECALDQIAATARSESQNPDCPCGSNFLFSQNHLENGTCNLRLLLCSYLQQAMLAGFRRA